ncbi:hypothetical protein MIDIC_140044 [Alphaproteobacteria bacterium]
MERRRKISFWYLLQSKMDAGSGEAVAVKNGIFNKTYVYTT